MAPLIRQVLVWVATLGVVSGGGALCLCQQAEGTHSHCAVASQGCHCGCGSSQQLGNSCCCSPSQPLSSPSQTNLGNEKSPQLGTLVAGLGCCVGVSATSQGFVAFSCSDPATSSPLHVLLCSWRC